MIQDYIVGIIVLVTLALVLRQWFKKKRRKCLDDGVTDSDCAGCTLSHFCKDKKQSSE